MNVKPIDSFKEYDALARWWFDREETPPPSLLLQAADGFIVQHDGKDLVAGWIYLTQHGIVGIVEWTVSNPAHNEPDLISMAVDMLYDFLGTHARGQGCQMLFSNTKEHSSLSRRLLKVGWSKCIGEPHAMFVKSLPPCPL
jgi:hypothetical protein